MMLLTMSFGKYDTAKYCTKRTFYVCTLCHFIYSFTSHDVISERNNVMRYYMFSLFLIKGITKSFFNKQY